MQLAIDRVAHVARTLVEHGHGPDAFLQVLCEDLPEAPPGVPVSQHTPQGAHRLARARKLERERHALEPFQSARDDERGADAVAAGHGDLEPVGAEAIGELLTQGIADAQVERRAGCIGHGFHDEEVIRPQRDPGLEQDPRV